ncbi:hypothetical protein MNV49_004294 [Pseudohyphozyma bogoriensis]|nr:hypothetical protein MNV49_004294 [Pseudohyphozyma bogoriensis]
MDRPSSLSMSSTAASSSSPPSSNVAKSGSVVKELRAALLQQAEQLDAGTFDIEDTLFNDPFPHLLLLTPLLGQREPPPGVTQCIDLLVAHASAKEIAVGLGERMASLRAPSSDEEGDEPQDEQENWDGAASVRELVALVPVYAQTLLKIRAVKPSSFLTTAVEVIFDTMSSLVEDGAFTRTDEGDEFATPLWSAVLGFVNELGGSDWISKTQEACIYQLQTFLLTTVLLLHQLLPPSNSIAEDYFLPRYPRYRIPGRARTSSPKVEALWSKTLDTSSSISLGSIAIWKHATSSPSSSSLGAFIVLSHLLASNPSTSLGTPPSEVLSQITPTLFATLGPGGSSGVRDDEALFWAWWCVESTIERDGEVEDGGAFTLVELLSGVSAISPEPRVRFLAFRLVSTLITKGIKKEETQFMILKDLLEDCPYDQLRSAAIGLLREVLSSKFEGTSSSIFVSPLLLHELENTLLRFSPLDLLSSATSPVVAKDFLEEHHRSTMEKLGFYYFLLSRDKSNQVRPHFAPGFTHDRKC